MARINLLDAIELHLPRGYTIQRKLGDGATSSVYLAERPGGSERLAVKVMLTGTVSDETLDRFLREMQILEKLDHQAIPRILEAGEANGSLFFTMPYIEGETLRTRLGRVSRLTVRDALLVASDIGNALDYAHSRGVVHRDVKPANIYLSTDHAYLMDFGLAYSSENGTESGRGVANMMAGTPEYMSPEQAAGDGSEDWRSDFFSLGCVLFEMLAGRTAFGGETVRETIARRLRSPAPDIRTIRPDVPDDVAAILKRTLDPYPAGRYATGAMLGAALDAALRQSSSVVRSTAAL
jgi:serine/threonine-protein kinase